MSGSRVYERFLNDFCINRPSAANCYIEVVNFEPHQNAVPMFGIALSDEARMLFVFPTVQLQYQCVITKQPIVDVTVRVLFSVREQLKVQKLCIPTTTCKDIMDG